MVSGKVLFRTDGNKSIGLGHVHRCLALAEIIAPEFDCTFAIREPLPGLTEMIRKVSGTVISLPNNVDYLEEASSLLRTLSDYEIIVLDGYSFNTEYQRILKSGGITVISIDDIHSYHFRCDAVINHAGGINRQLYSAEPYTEFYLGTQYCIVKKEFLDAAPSTVDPGQRENAVLICMGGADPHNHTMSVLQRCIHTQHSCHFYVIVGEAYQYQEELKRFVQSNTNVSVLRDVEADRLAYYMKKCPIAVCSPSGIAYEYLCIGGELYLEQTAENQHHIFEFLVKNSLGFRFSDFRVSDDRRIRASVARQKKEFDGLSRQRLLKIFREFNLENQAVLRKATPADVMLVFQWANDPDTRRNAFNPEPIKLEDHIRWFHKKLAEGNVYLYIFEFGKEAVGQIRFDIGREAAISYAIAPDRRGRGLGSILVKKGIQRFLNDTHYDGPITAYVKEGNESSKRIFSKLGFGKEADTRRTNSIRYTLKYDR